MTTSPPEPTAAEITTGQTLDLLESRFATVAQGVANGRYALWLGSGISAARLPGLEGVVQRSLEYLHANADPANQGCAHLKALEEAIELADLRPGERAALHPLEPVANWPHLQEIISSLVKRYAELLDIRVEGKPDDSMLWNAVNVRGTYHAGAEPGCEHLCLAILALEGVLSDIPSANWDGLIETAITQLTPDPEQVLRVTVLAADFREPRRRTRLLKFHGCAILAAQDEDRYRPALIGAQSQITDWPNHDEAKLMRGALQTLATERPTLMLGLSARDTDIQDLFSKAKSQMRWTWSAEPPAHVFAEDRLGDMQRNLLKVVYREEYGHHAEQIERGALIRAYAAPLLTALVLYVITAKLHALLDAAPAPGLDQDARRQLARGLTHLRDLIAQHAEPDRLTFIRELIAAENRTVCLFHTGTEPDAGETTYRPLTDQPAELLAAGPALAADGARELAAALAILGNGAAANDWELTLPPTAPGPHGALTLTATAGRSAVYFAANGHAAIHIEGTPAVAAAPGATIIVHSTEPVERLTRSPHARFGRTGHPGVRHLDMSTLLAAASDLEDLQLRFRQAAAA
jgi:hypothetical protein